MPIASPYWEATRPRCWIWRHKDRQHVEPGASTTEFSISVDIRAAPPRVWALISDIEGWPGWTPTVKSVERLDAGPLAVGSRARIRQPKLLPAVWQITS